MNHKRTKGKWRLVTIEHICISNDIGEKIKGKAQTRGEG